MVTSCCPSSVRQNPAYFSSFVGEAPGISACRAQPTRATKEMTVNPRRTSAFCFLPSAFCLLPSAFCLLPSAFCLSGLSPLQLRAQDVEIILLAGAHELDRPRRFAHADAVVLR